jgi:hypothetical protein
VLELHRQDRSLRQFLRMHVEPLRTHVDPL